MSLSGLASTPSSPSDRSGSATSAAFLNHQAKPVQKSKHEVRGDQRTELPDWVCDLLAPTQFPPNSLSGRENDFERIALDDTHEGWKYISVPGDMMFR